MHIFLLNYLPFRNAYMNFSTKLGCWKSRKEDAEAMPTLGQKMSCWLSIWWWHTNLNWSGWHLVLPQSSCSTCTWPAVSQKAKEIVYTVGH